MANSDWAREAPQKPEQRWFYFQPVLGQIPEPDWQFGSVWIVKEPEEEWLLVANVSQAPIHNGDFDYFWRKPYTMKGN